MPRWFTGLIVIILIVWVISDPTGLANFFKDIVDSLITFAKGVSK